MFGSCSRACSRLLAVIAAWIGRAVAAALESSLGASTVGAVAAALWPEACIACGALAAQGGLCQACEASVRATAAGPRCRRCDARLRPDATPREGCRSCRGRPLGVARVLALGPHEGLLRIAVRRYKFYGRRASARPLAALLARRLAREGLADAFDAVVSVPPTPGRERARGFDQAGALAAALAQALGAPYAAGALERPSSGGAEQKSLDRALRWRAAQQAFRASPRAEALLSGKRVLLVDDVCTSGATIAACAAACRAAGASGVTAACVTRQAREHRVEQSPARHGEPTLFPRSKLFRTANPAPLTAPATPPPPPPAPAPR